MRKDAFEYVAIMKTDINYLTNQCFAKKNSILTITGVFVVTKCSDYNNDHNA